MSDEKPQQDRTEQPTPKRLKEAREKGNVPRSRELTMTCVMLAGASALLFMAAGIGTTILADIRGSLSVERDLIFDPRYLPVAFSTVAIDVLRSLLPLGVLVPAAALGGAVLIGGWSFSASGMAFKTSRLNPIKGLARIFGPNGLNELVKALAKFALVAAASIVWLWYSSDTLLSLGRQPIRTAVIDALELCGVSLLIVSATLILIALVDVPFQLWNHRKKLKMTRQEVRDELKDTEGRPEVKSRIRMLQQQIANRRIGEEVPKADVVITNPTHFAVALKYTEGAMRAPRVVAKGKDLMASRIRDIARAAGVPLFSAPPLARALYSSTRLGQEIPAGLYKAVAQVLAYIYQLQNVARGAPRVPEPELPHIDESLYR